MLRLAAPLVMCRRLRLHRHGQARGDATLAMPLIFSMESDNSSNSTRRDGPGNTAKTLVSRPSPLLVQQTYFDSVTPDSFKFRRQKNDVVEHFRLAISEGDMDAVHSTYAELRKQTLQLRDSSQASSHAQAQSISQLTASDIRQAMSLALGPEISYSAQTRKEDKQREHDRIKRSGSASKADGALTQQMFDDMKTIFNFPIKAQDCQRALASLVLQKSLPSLAYEYFQSLCLNFKQYTNISHSRDGLVILHLCSKSGDLQTAHKMWDFLVEKEEMIEKEVRDFYLHILFKYGEAEKAMRTSRNGSFRCRLFPVSRQTDFSLASFLRGISRAGRGDWPLASKVADELLDRFKSKAEELWINSYEWHAVLMHKGIVQGGPAALRLVAEAVQKGQYRGDVRTFNILLLCHERELLSIAEYGTEEDVKRLFDRIEKSCRAKPDRRSFSIGISTLLGKAPSLLYRRREGSKVDATKTEHEMVKLEREMESDSSQEDELLSLLTFTSQSVPTNTPGQIHEATLLYDAFRSRNLLPDNTMVHLLITAHANTYIPSLSKAVELYQDLRSCFANQGSKMEGGIDRITYDVLLYACARSRDLKIAQEIIQDMINDGITLNEGNAADLVVLLMEASQSHQSAYEIYCRLRDSAEQIIQSSSNESTLPKLSSPFSKHGWSRIIHSFSRLKFQDSDLPPIEYVLEMMNDMTAAGVGHDMMPYASYLRLYGHTATSILNTNMGEAERRNTLDELQNSVIKMHHYFQSQTEFEPNMAIITALMDAYNRVRLTHSSLEIWNRLVLYQSNLIDSAIIAIILDGCGYTGLIKEARRIWKWTRSRSDSNLLCNKDVWDAYVECLARCGHLSEAIDVVFDEMQPELLAGGHQSADAKTMEMMLRFASHTRHRWTRNVQEEYTLLSNLKLRMRQEMPNVWDQVKSIDIPLYGK